MFYVLRPQSPQPLFHERGHPVYLDFDLGLDPEEAYVQRKRQEYLAALQQQQQRRDYEMAVEAEYQRHRARLAALAQQDHLRRHSAQPRAPACHGSSCTPANIVRGRYNRQRDAPHFSRRPCSQPDQSVTFDQLLAQLLGRPHHNETVPQQPPKTAKTTEPAAPVASTSATATATAATAQATPSTDPDPTEGHWSNAVQRTRSVAAISQISRTFDSLRRTFTFPSGPLVPIPGSETPRLAYNHTNAPIHAYEHALSELLTKLDAIDSFGFRGVRELRKEVVVKIEKELESLEKKVAEAIAASASPVIKSTEVIPEAEEPAAENQAPAEVEDKVMEEAEVAVAVMAPHTEELAEGYDIDTNEAATTVSAPSLAAAPVLVENAPVAGSPISDSEAQTIPERLTQPEVDLITFNAALAEPALVGTAPVESSPTQPEDKTVEAEAEIREVDFNDGIAVAAGPDSQSPPTLAERVPGEVVATSTPELPPQIILEDATTSSSESESEIEDAVDVTVSSNSDSDIEVTLEAGDGSASDAEKDFEMV